MLRIAFLTLAFLCLSGCATEFGMSQVEPGEFGTRSFELEAARKGYHRPRVYVAPQVQGFQLTRTAEGVQSLSWTALGESHAFDVTLPRERSEETLILESRGARVTLKGSQALLLSPNGAEVVPGGGPGLLPVLANPPLYLDVEFVNTIAPDSFPAKIEVRVQKVPSKEGAEASAGLVVGDVVREVREGDAGTPSLKVKSRQALAAWLCQVNPGTTLQFTVARGGVAQVVSAQTRERKLSEFRDPSSVSDDAIYFEEVESLESESASAEGEGPALAAVAKAAQDPAAAAKAAREAAADAKAAQDAAAAKAAQDAAAAKAAQDAAAAKAAQDAAAAKAAQEAAAAKAAQEAAAAKAAQDAAAAKAVQDAAAAKAAQEAAAAKAAQEAAAAKAAQEAAAAKAAQEAAAAKAAQEAAAAKAAQEAAAAKAAQEAAAAKAAQDAAAAKAAQDAAAAKAAQDASAAQDPAAAKAAEEARLERERAERDKAEGEGTSKAPLRTPEHVAELRKTPEGLARLIYDAIAFGDERLLSACWISSEDAKALLGKKLGKRWHSRAETERAKSWTALRRAHPDLRKAKIQSVELPVVDVKFGGRGLQRVKGGAIHYAIEGRKGTLPFAALFRVEDGTWKAFALVKAKKRQK